MPLNEARRRQAGCLGCLPILLVMLLLVGIAYLFRTQLMTAAGAYLVESDPLQKADAIVVMGGDEFGKRVVTAAELQKAGWAPYVLVSGPQLLLGPESEQMIEYARRQGYSPSIFRPINGNQNSTRSEAGIMGQYFRNHDIRKIILVTSNYHTKRAARLMRDANPRLDVMVTPAPDPFFTPSTWWETRMGEKTFLYEWMKTLATMAGK